MIEKSLSVFKNKISYGLFVVIFPVFYCFQANTSSYNKLPFLISYIRFFFFMSVMAFWISFLVRRMFYPYESNQHVSDRHLAKWYYVSVFFTAFLAKILFSIHPHLSFNDNLKVIRLSLFENYPIYLFIIMVFAYWLKANPQKNLYLSKLETTSSKEEAYLDLFSLYDHLIRKVKGQDKIDEKKFQLFDIVFIYVKSKEATVYLRDGAKIHCDKIVEILQDLGLIQWVVKISQNCYVNVMHILYPHYREGQYLVLQPATYHSMSKRKMTKMEVKKLSQFGSFMADRNIKMVINNKSDLDYRGEWDAFVTLN